MLISSRDIQLLCWFGFFGTSVFCVSWVYGYIRTRNGSQLAHKSITHRLITVEVYLQSIETMHTYAKDNDEGPR